MNTNPAESQGPTTNPLQPTTNPTPTTAQTPSVTPRPQKPGNIKMIKGIIIAVISIAVIVLGVYIYIDQSAKKKVRDRAAADEQIPGLIYKIRDDARNFYERNQSYKEWWPKSETLVQVSNLGSTVIYRKPDFQSYIVYAFNQTNQQYFCVDSRGFADYIVKVTDEQIKCQ